MNALRAGQLKALLRSNPAHSLSVRAAMNSIRIKKLANVFYPSAVPSTIVNGAALGAIDRFQKKHGGLFLRWNHYEVFEHDSSAL